MTMHLLLNSTLQLNLFMTWEWQVRETSPTWTHTSHSLPGPHGSVRGGSLWALGEQNQARKLDSTLTTWGLGTQWASVGRACHLDNDLSPVSCTMTCLLDNSLSPGQWLVPCLLDNSLSPVAWTMACPLSPGQQLVPCRLDNGLSLVAWTMACPLSPGQWLVPYRLDRGLSPV